MEEATGSSPVDSTNLLILKNFSCIQIVGLQRVSVQQAAGPAFRGVIPAGEQLITRRPTF